MLSAACTASAVVDSYASVRVITTTHHPIIYTDLGKIVKPKIKHEDD